MVLGTSLLCKTQVELCSLRSLIKKCSQIIECYIVNIVITIRQSLAMEASDILDGE